MGIGIAGRLCLLFKFRMLPLLYYTNTSLPYAVPFFVSLPLFFLTLSYETFTDQPALSQSVINIRKVKINLAKPLQGMKIVVSLGCQ